ncbi:MAG: CotH kinase family protein, partial [Rhodothermales bacterium]|nr:CotH kinase family protein [Rhodothermales bacterium]
PVWDYNIAFGNANYFDGGNTTGFRLRYRVPIEDPFHAPFWWNRFLEDPEFVVELGRRWEALRSGPLALDSLHAFIDANVEVLAEAQARNFTRWPVLDEWVWPNVVVEGSWAAEIAYLKSWLANRLTWIDQNIGSIGVGGSPETPFSGSSLELAVFPNPVRGQLRVTVSVPEVRGRIGLRIYDGLGRLVSDLGDRFVTGSGTSTSEHDLQRLSAGTYYLRVEGVAGSVVAPFVVAN